MPKILHMTFERNSNGQFFRSLCGVNHGLNNKNKVTITGYRNLVTCKSCLKNLKVKK